MKNGVFSSKLIVKLNLLGGEDLFIEDVPKEFREYVIPSPKGQMYYKCLFCGEEHDISNLLYTCPHCKGVLLLEHRDVKLLDPNVYHHVLDYRKILNIPALSGIFRYHEFIAPILPLEHIVYLGEGSTPMVKANGKIQDLVKREFYFKLDGLNPSASFKDRGMACAISYLNHLLKKGSVKNVLAICASTGDTSAAAALYASYIKDGLISAVILPKGKVTPQQLAQPLGHGAKVLEIPGVFDHCMKVVEYLADHYHVALLNSKNSWRILGQESFSYEIAQDFNWDLAGKVIVVPIGNAGNITAVLSGFLKFFKAGIIKNLPKIIGVQSEHADPVFRYYSLKREERRFVPVKVRPSVAQAAMIGDPVSMPRVIRLVEEYESVSGEDNFYVVNVLEQDIMDSMIISNRNGNVVCTQGGESLAGFRKAVQMGLVGKEEVGVLNSTAHMLKFITFQDMYFQDTFPPEFQVIPKKELKNLPIQIVPEEFPTGPVDEDLTQFVIKVGEQIASVLELKPKKVQDR